MNIPSAFQQSVLLAEPREVDVVAIERELTQLWNNATEIDDEGRRVPLLRACALNLVVLTEDVDRLRAVEELVADVTLEHPARIFLILANQANGRAELNASIAVRCALPVPGGKQVCCEQIGLQAAGPECRKIPSIVASLLVPDVPSVLLWKSGMHRADWLLPALAGLVDRVLIDSSEEPDPIPLLRAWEAFVASTAKQVLSGDLAWSHLTAWRSAMAQAFTSPDMRPLLDEIVSVDIMTSTSAEPVHGGVSQALLLLCWLADRLHWSAGPHLGGDTVRGITVPLTSAAGAMGCRIGVRPSTIPGPGGIEEVILGMRSGARVTLTSGEERSCIRSEIRVPGGTPKAGVLWVSDRDETTVVAQELEVLTRDPLYAGALDVLRVLLGGAR